MSQEQDQLPLDEEKEEQSEDIGEDRFKVADISKSDNELNSPDQNNEESTDAFKDQNDVPVDTEAEVNIPVDNIEEVKSLSEVELDDFVPPKFEEEPEIILPDSMKAKTLKKTVENIKNVQRKISAEFKKTSEKSISNHRKMNEAVVRDIKNDLEKFRSEIGSAIDSEKGHISSGFDVLDQKLNNSGKTSKTHVEKMKENLISEAAVVFSEVNKNIALNVDKIVNSSAVLLGNRRSDILNAKIDTENQVTSELDSYRNDSEKIIKKFSDVSSNSLKNLSQNSAETFLQLKSELQVTLNSFKSNSNTILTSFSDQNLDTFNRSKTEIEEKILAGKSERDSAIIRANERSTSASQNLRKQMEIKTQSLNNSLIQNISNFSAKIEDSHKESSASVTDLVEKLSVNTDNQIALLNKGISEGFSNASTAVVNTLTSTDKEIKNAVEENNKNLEVIRSATLEQLSASKTENISTEISFNEELKNTVAEYLEKARKDMITIIDNFGTNQIDRTTNVSQQLEENISKSFDDTKFKLSETVKFSSAITEKNLNDIKANLREVEVKAQGISNQTSTILTTGIEDHKTGWIEKSTQIVNALNNNGITVKSNIEKEMTAYQSLIESTDKESMAAFSEQVNGISKITEDIFEKMSMTTQKSFNSAEASLQKNMKIVLSSTGSTVETTVNQAMRRFDSSKSAIEGAINNVSTILETQSSNLLKQMRDSASENQDTLNDFLSVVVNQINTTLESLDKDVDVNLQKIVKQSEVISRKSEKKVEGVSDKAANRVIETIEGFIREFRLQRSFTLDRLGSILSDIPALVNRLQTKWTTQQEGEIIQTYSALQEENRKLQVAWTKFESDAFREINLFIPKK